MLRRSVLVTTILCCALQTGCREQPPSTPPEVPGAGPAATPDPGPAPGDQEEPAATTSDDSTPPQDLPAEEPAAAQSSTTVSAVETVAFAEPAAEGAVDVAILDWAATEALIASHKGKVVVVDMWSLACDPCRREFPNLVKLHNDRSDQVACISVSTDYAGIKSKPPEFYKPRVLEFLTEQKATFQNVLSSVDSETLFDQLALASIPAVYVYDKDGKLAQRFAGEEVHYDKEVVPLVEKLLAQ
jgi:thiol-disulfide isomerase/thioredoxin